MLALGATLAYATSTPERARRFRDGARRAAEQSAEARRHLARQARERELRAAYFADGPGRALYAGRATLRTPVLPPYPDAVEAPPPLGAFSFGAGYASAAAGARFTWWFDHHDAVSEWRLERCGTTLKGAIARPDATLTLYCPEDSGLLAPDERTAIRKLLGTRGSRIAEVAFVRHDHRAIREAIWAEYLAANPLGD